MAENQAAAEQVRRYYRLVDQDDVAGLVALFAEDAVYRRPGYEQLTGRAQLREFYRNRRVIAHGRHVLRRMTVAGDDVTVEGSFGGTLRDGRQVEVEFADIFVLNTRLLFQRRTTYFFAPLV
ncbi:nuclear transport factor 2 family protein [Micromonospora tarensis]|uniref:Nuclear transport factor 2 family protein n=1 Tax=Micromonospora tarensis TaxID=2806100 RepID=A0ABS1YPD6_9ACTN|nr:nuclear transport factor 2 family protein [Micromonospora tarensis]MBM0278956.1 nuclear transport factor 2 family protein [Micromonospora tarensis]